MSMIHAKREKYFVHKNRERERDNRDKKSTCIKEGGREEEKERERGRGYCTSVKAWRLPSCTQDPLNLKNEQKIMYSTHKD